MADFEVRINEGGFKRVGVTPSFDENLYGELLDEFAPDAQPLQVGLTPHLSWGRSPLGQLGMALAYRDDYEIAGVYGDNALRVHCVADEVKTNDTLLHETKHFIDDTTGEIEEGTRVMRRSMNRVLGTAAASGVVIGTALAVTNAGEPLLGAAVVVPALPMMIRSYWKAPHEVAARQFAADPEVTEAYGRVISYRQA